MRIEYTVQIWKEGNQFVAHAMPLDVASSGSTPDQARDALDEAVALFLKTAIDQGTIAEVLEESGYVHEMDAWRSPSFVAVERRTATVGA